MIPYGKNNKFRYNYKDNHPKKGCVNWWEVELGDINKSFARQHAKIELQKELEEMEMAKTSTKNKEDDCRCGQPLKINDPKRKIVRKVSKKK